jgi:hypothetical protein
MFIRLQWLVSKQVAIQSDWTRVMLKWLHTSTRVHLNQQRPDTFENLVALLDRFLDGKLRYDLEWDDFISWKNENTNIEMIREKIAKTEPLFFSKALSDRMRAVELLVEERNRTAALIGQPPRLAPIFQSSE